MLTVNVAEQAGLSPAFRQFPRDLQKQHVKRAYEPAHEISNNVVCATSKASDQPAHTCSLIRAFASHLNSIGVLSY